MRLIAELKMPRNNAWNGKWTGKDNKYTILFSTSKNMCKYIGNYRYDFGDGWIANVEIRKAEDRKMKLIILTVSDMIIVGVIYVKCHINVI